jgi:hypothetical protein
VPHGRSRRNFARLVANEEAREVTVSIPKGVSVRDCAAWSLKEEFCEVGVAHKKAREVTVSIPKGVSVRDCAARLPCERAGLCRMVTQVY